MRTLGAHRALVATFVFLSGCAANSGESVVEEVQALEVEAPATTAPPRVYALGWNRQFAEAAVYKIGFFYAGSTTFNEIGWYSNSNPTCGSNRALAFDGTTFYGLRYLSISTNKRVKFSCPGAGAECGCAEVGPGPGSQGGFGATSRKNRSFVSFAPSLVSPVGAVTRRFAHLLSASNTWEFTNYLENAPNFGGDVEQFDASTYVTIRYTPGIDAIPPHYYLVRVRASDFAVVKDYGEITSIPGTLAPAGVAASGKLVYVFFDGAASENGLVRIYDIGVGGGAPAMTLVTSASTALSWKDGANVPPPAAIGVDVPAPAADAGPLEP